MEEEDLVWSLEYDASVQKKLEADFRENCIKEFCPFCGKGDDPDEDEEVEHPTEEEITNFLRDKDSEIREEMMNAKEQFTVFIFNQEIKMETSRIQITDDAIVFNEKIPSVNFASCQLDINDLEDQFNKQKISLSAFGNIPPIPYVVYDEGYHLKIELFNNGFVRHEEIKFRKPYNSDDSE